MTQAGKAVDIVMVETHIAKCERASDAARPVVCPEVAGCTSETGRRIRPRKLRALDTLGMGMGMYSTISILLSEVSITLPRQHLAASRRPSSFVIQEPAQKDSLNKSLYMFTHTSRPYLLYPCTLSKLKDELGGHGRARVLTPM